MQSALIAMAMADRDDVRITLLEQERTLGGDHTWCFFDSDLNDDGHALVAPLVGRRWAGYDVAFPGFQRTVPTTYNHVSGARLAQVVRAVFARRPTWRLRLGVAATRLSARHVVIDTGDVIAADLVVDATGPQLERRSMRQCGYQKFVGLEVRLTAPHGLQRPVVMDAAVAQEDGLRFFYLLPLDAHRVLVEDTRFSDGATLNAARLTLEVRSYIEARGWKVDEVIRQEQGVLPLPWVLPATVEPKENRGARCAAMPLRAGYRGGWFHPITGYSFGSAVRLALHIRRTAPHSQGPALALMRRRVRRQQWWLMLLNRALFRHYLPADRWILMARFYRRPLPVIERFYAMTMKPWHFARLVSGRPPAKMRLRPWSPPAGLLPISTPVLTAPSPTASVYRTTRQEASS
ncbi:MAG: lycopene beta-cyclase CrtY [Myxococcales bacterium]|nr:lycopene beta-cyclase CrtY [Myxococcales bacterium]